MPVAAGTKRKRGEGQWALGYREPLNPNEQTKKDDDGLNVRAADRSTSTPSAGFDSIDPADLRGRFRWWGLYTQRKPGHRRRPDRDARAGGARRRVLHAAGPHRRRRSSPPTQLRVIGEICHDVTPATPPTSPTGRTSSCHWIRDRGRARRSGSGSRPSGLSTTEACGDTPRVDPRLARSPASPPTRSSTARRRSTRSIARYIGDPEFSNLPRKFKTAITGSPGH